MSAATKAEWQRRHRIAFRDDCGYSTAADYGAGRNRETVMSRDGHACVRCGMTDKKHKEKWDRPITIDHKNKDRSDNSLDNLQTLCLSCHGRKDNTNYRREKATKHKEEILRRKLSGDSYDDISRDIGVSVAAIWKWFKRWCKEDGILFSEKRGPKPAIGDRTP